MKTYIFLYNGQHISKKEFIQSVPKDCESNVEDGEYYFGNFTAIKK